MPYQMNKSLNSQQGVVIIIALFMVALIAMMAYVMMNRLQRDTLRTRLILNNQIAEHYAQGSIAWAMDQLRNNLDQKKPQQLTDDTPIALPVVENNGYKISSIIFDLQGRYNINNVNGNTKADFARLISAVDPSVSTEKALLIANAVSEWVSTSAAQNEKYYLEQALPYRPAHQKMQSVSELRLVKGVTAKLFNALQPHITVLPSDTTINIQTASAPVLVTLGQTMTLEAANEIIKIRQEKPFVSAETFSNLDVVKNLGISDLQKKITTESDYFLVETTVSMGDQQVLLYTWLKRKKEDKAYVNVLSQSKGTM